MSGPVEPVEELLKNFCRKLNRFECDAGVDGADVGWARVLMLAEAHRDESGRKMVTRVRTLDDMAGMRVKYCRMEKIAVQGWLAARSILVGQNKSNAATYQE